MNGGVEAQRKEWSLDLIELKIHRRKASGIKNRICQKVEGNPGRAKVKGKDAQSLKILAVVHMGVKTRKETWPQVMEGLACHRESALVLLVAEPCGGLGRP